MGEPERTTEGIGGRLEHIFVRSSLVLAAALLLSALGGWSQVRARAVADSAAAALEASAAHAAGKFDVKHEAADIATVRAVLGATDGVSHSPTLAPLPES